MKRKVLRCKCLLFPLFCYNPSVLWSYNNAGGKKMKTIYQFLEQYAVSDSKKTLFIYRKRSEWVRESWESVLEDTKKPIFFLQKRGFDNNKRAAILSENSPEWLKLMCAISAVGTTLIPIDINISDAEVHNIIGHSETSLLFFSEKKRSSAEKMKEMFPNLEIALIDDVFAGQPEAIGGLPEQKDDDLTAILYTSGTTGNPKGVMITNANLYWNAVYAQGEGPLVEDKKFAQIPYTKDDISLVILPLHHIMTLSNVVFKSFLAGSALLFSPSFKPEDLFETIKEGSPTFMALVPQLHEIFYKGLTKKIRNMKEPVKTIINTLLSLSIFCEKKQLPNPFKLAFRKAKSLFGTNIKWLISGGSAINPQCYWTFRAIGIKTVNAYGLTETTGGFSGCPGVKAGTGSVGKPVMGGTIRIENPNEDGVGEIVIKGNHIMKGYYKNEEATKESIRDGWFYTGDLGYIDSEGHIFYSGRLKNIIVLPSGKNVYPDEITAYYIENTTAIDEICVFGLNLGDGEKVAALIKPTTEALSKPKKELYEFFEKEMARLNAGLPSYKVASEWKLTPEPMPKTTTRKHKVGDVRKLYLTLGRDIEIGRTEEEDLFFKSAEGKKLLALLCEITKKSPIDIYFGAILDFDLGMDSLGRVELLSRLMSDFGLDFDEKEILALEKVVDIYNLMQKNKN